MDNKEEKVEANEKEKLTLRNCTYQQIFNVIYREWSSKISIFKTEKPNEFALENENLRLVFDKHLIKESGNDLIITTKDNIVIRILGKKKEFLDFLKNFKETDKSNSPKEEEDLTEQFDSFREPQVDRENVEDEKPHVDVLVESLSVKEENGPENSSENPLEPVNCGQFNFLNIGMMNDETRNGYISGMRGVAKYEIVNENNDPNIQFNIVFNFPNDVLVDPENTLCDVLLVREETKLQIMMSKNVYLLDINPVDGLNRFQSIRDNTVGRLNKKVLRIFSLLKYNQIENTEEILGLTKNGCMRFSSNNNNDWLGVGLSKQSRKFCCAASPVSSGDNEDNNYVLGSTDGKYRFFSDSNFAFATNRFGLNNKGPIIGLDINSDQHQVVITTSKHVILHCTVFNDSDNNITTWFKKNQRLNRRQPYKNLNYNGCDEKDDYSFTRARFNWGNGIEEFVISSYNTFILIWKLAECTNEDNDVHKVIDVGSFVIDCQFIFNSTSEIVCLTNTSLIYLKLEEREWQIKAEEILPTF
eukprot:TRINITY_DN1000_c0_g1_i1.p1 TRINITY_DN1000_c0_g1~~TRINITY_DN1000_c0_g1_i1.p1  ORF type:complete len:529 (+),score=116.40 TRINITY_DN1000_c0_g1_i1:394-1980(+)